MTKASSKPAAAAKADSQDTQQQQPQQDQAAAAAPKAKGQKSEFTRLDQVRALPEVAKDAKGYSPCQSVAGSIVAFKASESDRRTMLVVHHDTNGFAQREA